MVPLENTKKIFLTSEEVYDVNISISDLFLSKTLQYELSIPFAFLDNSLVSGFESF